MSVKLRISVTKEILEKSMWCNANAENVKYNCAVAVAVRDIFPKAKVFQTILFVDREHEYSENVLPIVMPTDAFHWIKKFDNSSPIERLMLDPISFEIKIPDEVIERINIDELKPLLQNHPTLQLVEA